MQNDSIHSGIRLLKRTTPNREDGLYHKNSSEQLIQELRGGIEEILCPTMNVWV